MVIDFSIAESIERVPTEELLASSDKLMDLYDDAFMELCIGLVRNHSFYDGNKRIAALALFTTLDLINIQLQAANQEPSDIILKLAASEIDDAAFFQ